MKDGQLYRKSFQGQALRCLGLTKVEEVMNEVHSGDCGSHLGGRRLFEQLIFMGYFRPSMENEAMDFVKRCEACQRLRNLIHAPLVDMGSVTSPWPFHTWSIDLIGPISPPSRGKIWIIVATESFTKWSEAITLKKATSEVVRNFVLEYIICRFGIPKRICQTMVLHLWDNHLNYYCMNTKFTMVSLPGIILREMVQLKLLIRL